MNSPEMVMIGFMAGLTRSHFTCGIKYNAARGRGPLEEIDALERKTNRKFPGGIAIVIVGKF